MKRLVQVGLVMLALALFAGEASAQTQAGPGSRLTWTQVASTLADAQALTYRAYFDEGTTGVVLVATCAATATPNSFNCVAPIPAVTPGSHTVQLTAANVAGESPKSVGLQFTMQAVANTPTGLGILP